MRRRDTGWLRRLRRFFTAVERAFDTSESIEMIEQGEHRLVIRSNGAQLVADRRRRAFTRSERVVARFDDIESIDVKHRSNDDGPSTWTVSLHMSWFSRVHVGSTSDDAEASIVAARIATITGKKVLAWR